MGNLFNINSPIMEKARKIVDLMILNMLLVVMCIPIFTAGAAITALYAAVGRLDREEGSSVVRGYLQSFRDNFKQATIIELILLPFGIPTILTLILMQEGITIIPPALQIPSFLVGIAWFLVSAWVYPLLSRFDNNNKTTLKNALLCSLGYLPKSLVMVALNLAPWAVLYYETLYFMKLLPLWLVFWFAFAAFLIYRLNRKLFE